VEFFVVLRDRVIEALIIHCSFIVRFALYTLSPSLFCAWACSNYCKVVEEECCYLEPLEPTRHTLGIWLAWIAGCFLSYAFFPPSMWEDKDLQSAIIAKNSLWHSLFQSLIRKARAQHAIRLSPKGMEATTPHNQTHSWPDNMSPYHSSAPY
jgi:hypothetical protein